jgi:hypothetical protein
MRVKAMAVVKLEFNDKIYLKSMTIELDVPAGKGLEVDYKESSSLNLEEILQKVYDELMEADELEDEILEDDELEDDELEDEEEYQDYLIDIIADEEVAQEDILAILDELDLDEIKGEELDEDILDSLDSLSETEAMPEDSEEDYVLELGEDGLCETCAE